MASTFRLLLDGTPADDALLTAMTSLEVEENADLPGAMQFQPAGQPLRQGRPQRRGELPVSSLRPNSPSWRRPKGKRTNAFSTASSFRRNCIWRPDSPTRPLQVWGQDASWLMNLEEKAREWVDVTDVDVAATIFNAYGIAPAPDNADEDSPSHTESGHRLMQRGTDIQFLRSPGAAHGRLCRVVCEASPVNWPAISPRPGPDGDPVVALPLNDTDNWTVRALDIEWDVTRPTAVQARQALFNDDTPEGVSGDAADSGLPLLGERDLATFAGTPMQVMLTAPVDDAGELTLRARALLRESAWFVRCEGEADVGRLQAILRVGTVVQICGHRQPPFRQLLRLERPPYAHRASHTMKFTLLRNAVGPEPRGRTAGAGRSVLT